MGRCCGRPCCLALACQLDASALASAQPTPELCDYEKGTGLTRTRPLTESLCVSLPLPIAHQTHTYPPPPLSGPTCQSHWSRPAKQRPRTREWRGAQVFFGLMRRGGPRAQSRQPSGGSMSGRIEARTGPRDKQLLCFFLFGRRHSRFGERLEPVGAGSWSKGGTGVECGELPRWE